MYKNKYLVLLEHMWSANPKDSIEEGIADLEEEIYWNRHFDNVEAFKKNMKRVELLKAVLKDLEKDEITIKNER